jgi:hypothetical protein
LPNVGDNEQVCSVPDQREMAAPAHAGVERAFVDSLAQFYELYRRLARWSKRKRKARPGALPTACCA